MKERLQKYLARAGIASRRQAEVLIARGEVLVNGEVALLGCKVDPDKDEILWLGKEILPGQELLYLMVNKPKDVVTTARDPEGRPTVLDLIPSLTGRVFPVGRLDLDSEGLLLLTNDGDLAYGLTHPKFEVEKTYHVLVAGHPIPSKLKEMAEGLELDDGWTAPARVALLGQEGANSWLSVAIHEGRKRQVKRMCAAIGHPVEVLRRVSFGGLGLDSLPLGKWRFLRAEEVEMLRKQIRRGD